jgi:V/A-type H+/Na+-transporting ATPase subunit F
MNGRIAFVGPEESVRAFALLGVDIVPAREQGEAIAHIHRLRKDMTKDDRGIERNTYAIIFVSEHLVHDLPREEEAKFSGSFLPAIIPTPSNRGNATAGVARLKKLVERAVGSDILQ